MATLARLIYTVSVFCLILPVPAIGQQADTFTWDNAVIYLALTDRFNNGDQANDRAYGRGSDATGAPYESGSGHFQGGDFKGLLEKVNEGYFTDLGINALWISPVVEQVHGWVGGENGATQEYAYHGYWPLDFTQIDENWGTEDELVELISACHERGIRVIADIVLNHAGYNTLADMDSLSFGSITSNDWKTWRPKQGETWASYHDLFIDYQAPGWSTWWGSDFVRADLQGYDSCGTSETTRCVHSLPDFKTDEVDVPVELPPVLRTKWSTEKESAQMSAAAELANSTGAQITPRLLLVKWAADLVEKFGFDGIRLDTAKHLDFETIQLLKSESQRARRVWLAENTAAPPGDIWILGEVYGAAVEESEYFGNGVDALLNFAFKDENLADYDNLDSLYAAYSSFLHQNPNSGFVSFTSSHDDGLYDHSDVSTSTALLLAPGATQIYYGEESGRTGDARSSMNWSSTDEDRLEHFQKIASFKRDHPAVGLGVHERLPGDGYYAFHRTLDSRVHPDKVLVVMGATGRVRLNVSRLFADDTALRDAYSGKVAIVSFGSVQFDAGDSGILLISEL